MKLEHSTVTELLARMARRELTAETLARACLETIDAREPEVQAWAHVDADGESPPPGARPRRGARRAHGSIGVKDV